MSRPLVIRAIAEEELAEAYQWYEKKQRGLGNRFLQAVERAFDDIRARPLSPAVVFDDVRRVRVRRFPYGVYYRVVNETLIVVAVFHGSRDPKRLEGPS
jgi:plasmid stabilization system protein ParE